MVKIVDTIRTVPGGAAIGAGVNVAVKKEVDGSLVTTAVTDAAGRFSYEADGHFGPYRYEVTSGGTTKAHSSKSQGYAGPVSLGELHEYFRVWSDGVLSGVENELQVTSAGTTMTVTVGKGSAIVKGLLYRQSLATAGVTLDAADGAQPRHDLIVVEVTRAGQTEEGKARLTFVKGTPAVSPADPSPIQTAATWQIPIARVLVGAGVTAIAAVGKIVQTGYRTYASVHIPTGHVTSDMILDGAIVNADVNAAAAIAGSKLAAGTVTTTQLGTAAVETANILNAAVTTNKIADLNVTVGKIAAAAITGDKIAADTIGASNIAPGAIGSSEIAALAVGETELADNAVTAVKIAANAVGASEIAAGAVGTDEIADGAITAAKFHADLVEIVAGSRATGQALTNLLEALHTAGIIDNQTVA
jgi:hypothetical protein